MKTIHGKFADFIFHDPRIIEVRVKSGIEFDRHVALEIWSEMMIAKDPLFILWNSKYSEFSWKLDGLMTIMEIKPKVTKIAIIPQNSLTSEVKDFLLGLIQEYFDLEIVESEEEGLKLLKDFLKSDKEFL